MVEPRKNRPSGGSTKAGQEPVGRRLTDEEYGRTDGKVGPFIWWSDVAPGAFLYATHPADTKAGLPGAAQAGSEGWRPDSLDRAMLDQWRRGVLQPHNLRELMDRLVAAFLSSPAAPATEKEKP